jgi:hypothetical protein
MSGRKPSRLLERRATGRGRGILGLAFLLLATSLALPGELLTAEASEVPAELDEATRASFDEFASVWMDRLHQTGAGSLQHAATGASSRVFGPEFRTELRATGDSEAPYLGLLRYVEHSYSCSSSSAPRCRVSHSTPILEIFHFRNGRWVH